MKNEVKVGVLFLFTAIVIVLFVSFLGSFQLFSNSKEIHLLYNFAGGIEKGSPVRVMGIKVGKVNKISFDANKKDKNGEEVKLILTINVEEKAWNTIREDSQFYINLAGIIGEKYIEITPGSLDSTKLKEGSYYRGVDPPRIDQLISQSYSLAGKIVNMLEDNKGNVVNIIKNIDDLVANVNKTLKLVDQENQSGNEFIQLISNLNKISSDVAHISPKLKSKEAQETIHLLYRLLWRLEGLDDKAIKKFFQEEGIKAKLF